MCVDITWKVDNLVTKPLQLRTGLHLRLVAQLPVLLLLLPVLMPQWQAVRT
jgi:hypothetical protein